MNYLDYLNNDLVKEQYHKIDLINPYAISHGMRHVKNVCKAMDNLCNILNIDNEETDALLIACALHDIGQVDGRENHGAKSKDFIIKNFNDELRYNKYYNEFGINIKTNKSDNFEEQFLNEKHPYKVFKVLENLANMLNCTPIVQHNSVNLDYKK